ncbi:hypothetical protein CUR178_07253 [Leishmania enriettii]|uniref:RING-type domain-containing protein n=1 Tax=Leishmania enriettii TaxID=5663 RepID=A0A836GMD6_LEIEN|nr:hypothetical protein CUR178_07253 [Leishmania enriettii]
MTTCATALLTALLVVLGRSSSLQHVDARVERQTYAAYRTPHLCSYRIMQSAACPGTKPMCCVASSAVRCCDGATLCGNCTDDIVGYEMPKSSVIIGCFSLSVLVLLGSIIMSGVGRHLAWVVERRRVIESYRRRLLLRSAEAREFKKELAETEEGDIDDAVGCVICCARHIDVALTPCGHVCCCRFCAKRLRECPVCRSSLQRCFDLPLYYVKQLLSATETAEEDKGSGVGQDPVSPPMEMASTAREDIRVAGEAACSSATAEDFCVESAMAPSTSNCCISASVSLVADAQGGTERLRCGSIRAVAAADRRMIEPFSKRCTRFQYPDDDDENRDESIGSDAASTGALLRRVPVADAATSPTRLRGAVSEGADTTAADASTHHWKGYISVER